MPDAADAARADDGDGQLAVLDAAGDGQARGADFTFTLLTPEANVTATWPSAGTAIDGPAAACAARAGYQQDTQGQERKAESGEHAAMVRRAAREVHRGIP